MRIRRSGPIVAALAVTTLAAGCTDSDSGTATGLAGALTETPAEIGGEQYFAYSDVAAGYDLGAYDNAESPYATAAMYGLGEFAPIFRSDPEYLPTQEADDASAISVGEAPDIAFRFVGVDGAVVADAFDDADGERSDLDGGTLLVRREDHEMDLTDDAVPPTVLTAMNTIWYDDDTLIGSSVGQHVEDWVESADSLADSGTYDGATECLGEEIVGAVLSGEPAGVPAGVTVFATATAGTTEDEWTDVLCLRSDDADALSGSVESSLADGRSAVSGEPWSELLGDATVEVVEGDWLRVVTTERPSVFFRMYDNKDLGALLTGA